MWRRLDPAADVKSPDLICSSVSNLRGEEVAAGKQTEAQSLPEPRCRLGVAFLSCLRHQRQTWTRDRCCITSAQRAAGVVQVGQGMRSVSLLSADPSSSHAGRDKENAVACQLTECSPRSSSYPPSTNQTAHGARRPPGSGHSSLFGRGVLDDVGWRGRSLQSG